MPTVTPADLTSTQTIAPAIQGTPHNPIIPEQNIPLEQPNPQTPAQDTKRYSPELAQLARRERAIREEGRRIYAEKQAFEARQAEIQQNAEAQYRQKLVSNPWDTLIEAGLTPDQATELMLNKPQPQDLELQNLRREIEGLKRSQDDSKAQMSKQLADQYNEARRQMALEADLLVKSDATYEPIRTVGAEAAIPTLIEDVFHRGLPGKYRKGFIMSVEEAASMVNEHVIDEAVRMSTMRAVKERLGRETSPQEIAPRAGRQAFSQPARKPYQESMKPQSNTLSNTMAASTQTTNTDRERRERAILAYQGKL